jgi:PAS domain S-box-containing protein
MQVGSVASGDEREPVQLSVLAIDGNEENLILCVTAMGRRGHRVSASAAGREGFRLARSQPFDAIVVSHKLPDISGIDLLKALREHVPGTPVIYVVPTGAEDLVLKALDAGATTYLLRTPRFHELLPPLVEEVVAEVRRGRRLELEQRAHAKDVEELRRIEDELTGTEARLQVLLQQAPIVLWTVDRELRFTSSTGAGLASLGLKPEDVRSRSLQEYFGTQDPEFPPILAHTRALAGEPAAFEFEWAGRKFEVHLSPLRSASEEIVGVVGVAFDVTEQRQAVEDLHRSEERFQLLGRATNDMVWDWDLETDAVWRNGVFTTALGYAAEEIQPNGAWWDSLVHPDDRGRVLPRMRAVIHGEDETWSDEYRVRRKDGTYAIVLERGFIIRNPEGKAVRMVGSAVDLTSRRRADEVQRATYRISEAATSAKSLDALYETIHSIVAELMPAGNFYVALIDREAKTLSFPYFVDEFEPKPEPQPLGAGLTEYVIRTGRPLLATPEVFEGLMRTGDVVLIGPPSIDWVGVPLVVGDETIGALVVQTYKEGVRYGPEERDILSFVSDQIANAIDRKRTEEMLRRRDSILEVVRFAAEEFLRARQTEDQMPEVLRRFGESARVSRAYIFRNSKGPDGSILTQSIFEWNAPGVKSFLDPPNQPPRSLRERGFARWEETLGAGGIIVGHTRDFPATEQPSLAAQGILSIVVVPIFARRDWWGFMGFDQCDQIRTWTLPEVDALRTAAGTLGAGLERARSESALRESEARFRRMAENAQDVIYRYRIAEPRGFEYVSPAVTQQIGYTPEEHYADPDFSFKVIHPEDRPVLEAAMQAPALLRKPLFLRWVRKDGTVAWTEQHNVPILDDAGNLVAIEGIARDITERRWAEEAIRQSEERYRILFENNPQPMLVYELPSLCILAVNEAAVRHYGYTREEFLSMTVKDIRPAEDVPKFVEFVRDLKPGMRMAGIWRHRKKDGAIIDVDIVSHSLDFGGRNARLVLLNDVTEKKRAQEALQASERRFRTLFESAADGILLIDRTGTVLDVNPAGEAIGGQPRAVLVGKNMADLIPPEELERARRHLRGLLKGQPQEEPFEMRLRTSDGRVRFLETRSRAIQEPLRGTYIETIVRDVTEEKEMQRRLLESERLASMGQMAGYVAHEINNPLANISLLVAAIQRRTKDTEILERLEKINVQRRHSASIISDILSFSKQREIQAVELDLREVVEVAVEQAGQYRREGVRLVTQLGDRRLIVAVDSLQMQEVFINLLKNAFEATSSGSVTVRAEEHAEGIAVSVADTGPGIDPDILDRMFQPFVTTKRKLGGTGLGLALCKSVVNAHGGTIRVSSSPGKGATFTVTLPRGDATEGPGRG